jgi:oxalate decarboxylase/phosphoglucose isomerase-like protein (cupin superfamily)
MPRTAHHPDRLTVGAEELTLDLTSSQSGGMLLGLTVRMPSGGGPPVLHRHDPFELYRVEQGELAFYLADDAGEVRRRTAGPGEAVAIPAGREHTIRNESEGEARAFVVFAPGAGMERFIRAAGALAAGGTPAIEDVLALAAAHGVELTRPIPPR